MVFYKSLTSLGIGAATVDTRLAGKEFYPGDVVKGDVFVRGGHGPQQIDDIYLYLVVVMSKGGKKFSHVMQKFRLAQSFVIQGGEQKQIPFQIQLPMETPMSTGSFPIYFKTGLDIKMAVDHTDMDRIEVFPAPIVKKLLKQIVDAEFILYRIHNEYDPDQKPYPFFQMYQFRPTGRYHGYVDELNVVFRVTDVNIQMDMELIRFGKNLNSVFSWEYRNPNGTLAINNQKVGEDPVRQIHDMLNRKRS
jgi:sporulation-control protein